MNINGNKGLEERHLAEEAYFDQTYEEGNHYPRHYRYHPTYVIFQKMKQMLGNVEGKMILEYGCGEGWSTAELAELGGTIESFDISATAIEHAKTFVQKKNLDMRCKFKKLAAECLDYSDNSFDIAFGFAILHHLNLETALLELHRVMRPGGKAFFAEPLGTNPVLNLYRQLTPQYHTIDEQPIAITEFAKQVSQFSSFSHKEFYLTALIPLTLSYVRIVPAKHIHSMIKRCMHLDDILLSRYQCLGKFCWYTIITLEK